MSPAEQKLTFEQLILSVYTSLRLNYVNQYSAKMLTIGDGRLYGVER